MLPVYFTLLMWFILHIGLLASSWMGVVHDSNGDKVVKRQLPNVWAIARRARGNDGLLAPIMLPS